MKKLLSIIFLSLFISANINAGILNNIKKYIEKKPLDSTLFGLVILDIFKNDSGNIKELYSTSPFTALFFTAGLVHHISDNVEDAKIEQILGISLFAVIEGVMWVKMKESLKNPA